MAFIPNPENKPCVGHKDHNKANNTVENLYWCTHAENTQHGVGMGKINAKKRGTTKKDLFKRFVKLQSCKQGRRDCCNCSNPGFPRTTISSLFNGRSNGNFFQFALQELK